MKKFLKSTYLVLILAFLYLPIVLLIAYSFNASKSRAQWTGFTLRWYIELFKDPQILRALYVTLSIALIATAASVVMGTIAALGIHSMRPSTKTALLNITYLPMLTPDIVTGISMMILFVFINMPLGYFTMLLAHIAFCTPYVIFAVLPKLTQMNPHSYEAALDLGATPNYALFKVILPEIKSGIITGALLSFTLSLDDFVISFFTSTLEPNLSVLIYSMARRGINPTINALSALMFVVILALLLIINKRSGLEDTTF